MARMYTSGNYSVEERNDAREKGSAKEGMLSSAQVEY